MNLRLNRDNNYHCIENLLVVIVQFVYIFSEFIF